MLKRHVFAQKEKNMNFVIFNSIQICIVLCFACVTSPLWAQQLSPQPAQNVEVQQEMTPLQVQRAARRSARTAARGGVASIVGRYGTILSQTPAEGGLTAWTVEKNNRRATLYSTPDGNLVFAGVILYAGTDTPPTSGTPVPPAQSPQHAAPSSPALQGTFPGDIPASLRAVDSLAGVKEGKGGVKDTLYIIVDPRCGYCQKTYSELRPYVEKGRVTVKWIPAVALGNAADGVPRAATILEAKDPKVIARVLGNHETILTKPSQATSEALARNLDFLFGAFQQNPAVNDGRAGVPVAFFLDRNTGGANMMTGVSEPEILEYILGPKP
jgi:protein-disulfide isomerase